MKKLLFTTLLAVCTLLSCTKGEDGDKEVVLTGGTSTTQTIFADQSGTAGEGIKFNASAPWTAAVNAVANKADGGSNLSWLELSAYSGGAGEHTLTMTLQKNLTGTDRKARIEIICGGTTITITIEQKGTTQGGEKPISDVRLVSKVTSHSMYDTDDTSNKDEVTFIYDDQNRVIESKMKLSNVAETDFLDKYVWEYNGNVVTYKNDFFEKGATESYSTTESGTINLNADGIVESRRAGSVSKHNNEIKSTYDFTETYTYTNGHLTQLHEIGEIVSTNGTYNEDRKRLITWQDGNIMKEGVGSDSWYVEYQYKDTYDKKCNIDISHIVGRNGSDMVLLPLNTGKRPKGLISQAIEYSGLVVDGEIDYNLYRYDYTYEYDDRGYVVKITETHDSGSIYIVEITYKN